MNLPGEINCIGLCMRLSDFAPFVALFIVISIALLAASMMLRNPRQRIMTFISAHAAILVALALTFYLMDCSWMLTFYLYLAYVGISTVLIFAVLKYYDRIMIKRLGAKPVGGIMGWAQEFVDRLVAAKVYYFDSAVPRAFASGKSIFVSIGLIEMLDNDELKAVLAHEAWHIRNNSRTPYMKRLSMMAFSSSESEIECSADLFAAEIAGSAALFSARNKVDKVFI